MDSNHTTGATQSASDQSYTLLSIAPTEQFVGNEYFKDPSIAFRDHSITPLIEAVKDPDKEDFAAIEEKYNSEDIDGVLLHWLDDLVVFTEQDVFPDVPVLFGGHLLPRYHRKRAWKKAVETGRDIYLFTGSVRAARAYGAFLNTNVKWIIAPIMGLSRDVKFEYNSPERPQKQHDIMFFSLNDPHKRPHMVLMAAHEAAKRLGRKVDVVIAGPQIDQYDYYNQAIMQLAERYDETVNTEITGYIHDMTMCERVKESRAIYLPAVYEGETTCYAAWEAVSYDVPFIGADWNGIGEAARVARHPKTTAVPLVRVPSYKSVFPDGFVDAHPTLASELKNEPFTPISVDQDAAVDALVEAIQFDEQSYTPTFHIPERVRVETTVSAMKDALTGNLTVSRSRAARADKSNTGGTGLGLVSRDEKPYLQLLNPDQTNIFALQAMTEPSISPDGTVLEPDW